MTAAELIADLDERLAEIKVRADAAAKLAHHSLEAQMMRDIAAPAAAGRLEIERWRLLGGDR